MLKRLFELHFVRFILHGMTGALATIVHYTLMFLLLKFVGFSALTASSAGFIGGAITKFILSHTKVFTHTSKFTHVIFRFAIAICIQAILNYFLLKFFLHVTELTWMSQIITTGIIMFINYLIYYFWVFR